MSADIQVNYKTPKKNKEILLRFLPEIKEEIKSMSNINVLRAIEFIKSYTMLKLKQEISEKVTVLDFFDNPQKVLEILNKYVVYHFNDYTETQYTNNSIDLFNKKFFDGISSVKYSFVLKEKEKIILHFRELEIL